MSFKILICKIRIKISLFSFTAEAADEAKMPQVSLYHWDTPMLKSLAESLTGHTKLFDAACIGNEIDLLGCTMMYKSGRLFFTTFLLLQKY